MLLIAKLRWKTLLFAISLIFLGITLISFISTSNAILAFILGITGSAVILSGLGRLSDIFGSSYGKKSRYLLKTSLSSDNLVLSDDLVKQIYKIYDVKGSTFITSTLINKHLSDNNYMAVHLDRTPIGDDKLNFLRTIAYFAASYYYLYCYHRKNRLKSSMFWKQNKFPRKILAINSWDVHKNSISGYSADIKLDALSHRVFTQKVFLCGTEISNSLNMLDSKQQFFVESFENSLLVNGLEFLWMVFTSDGYILPESLAPVTVPVSFPKNIEISSLTTLVLWQVSEYMSYICSSASIRLLGLARLVSYGCKPAIILEVSLGKTSLEISQKLSVDSSIFIKNKAQYLSEVLTGEEKQIWSKLHKRGDLWEHQAP